MGIRVNKMLGYGLTNVKCRRNGFINDERFNLEDGYFSRNVDQEEYSIKKFTEHLKKIVDEDKKKNGFSMLEFEAVELKSKKYEFYDVIDHDSEFGKPSVVLFRPFLKDWKRHDDIIDYIELDATPISKVKKIKRSLYPYDGYINLKTKLNYILSDKEKIQLHEVLRMSEYLNDEQMTKAAIHYGFIDKEDMLKNIVPIVPTIIHEYCKWLKVFKNPDTVYELTPLIYTIWR